MRAKYRNIAIDLNKAEKKARGYSFKQKTYL